MEWVAYFESRDGIKTLSSEGYSNCGPPFRQSDFDIPCQTPLVHDKLHWRLEGPGAGWASDWRRIMELYFWCFQSHTSESTFCENRMYYSEFVHAEFMSESPHQPRVFPDENRVVVAGYVWDNTSISSNDVHHFSSLNEWWMMYISNNEVLHQFGYLTTPTGGNRLGPVSWPLIDLLVVPTAMKEWRGKKQGSYHSTLYWIFQEHLKFLPQMQHKFQ